MKTQMTIQKFKEIATKKLNALPTANLIAEVKKLANDYSNGVEIVFDIAIDILMSRLSEDEFIKLCNEVYNAKSNSV